jgi:ABC-2 type transport system permease protein
MKFMSQVGHEIRNIVRSKFLLILGILVLVWSIASPVIGVIAQAINAGNNGGPIGRPIPLYSSKYAVAVAAGDYYYRGGDNGQEPITVEDVTIPGDNPFYWNIKSILQDKEVMEVDKTRFSTPEALDLMLELMDQEVHYYVTFAKNIATQTDYRQQLAWGNGLDTLYDKFFYEHNDADPDALKEVAMNRKGLDETVFKKKYIDITAGERQAAIIKADEALSALFEVVESNDFPKFIDLRIAQENATIASVEENIKIQEQAIIDNPSQEENLNQMIEELRKQIKYVQENNIPILRMRLEKNIIPGETIWQNTAISDIENNRSQIIYNRIMTEEEFNREPYNLQQYGSYRKYQEKMQNQLNQWNNAILIAKNSLDAGKPDMKYVPNGPRMKTVQFLSYSIFIALFGVLVGGWLIASEYQQGTIRLLMIRPKKRVKILMSKFVAAFALCLGMYLAGSLLNFIANGICFGFSDFAYPNYSVSGETGFLLYFLPKLLMCIVPILFAFTVAFMLSVVVRNTAVSVAVPIVCFVACFIGMLYFAYRSAMEWLAYTPVPFVLMYSFFIQDYSSPIWQATQNGITFSLPYGIGLLLVLSAACTMVAMLVFKKRDITN